MDVLAALAPYASHFTRPVADIAADLERFSELLMKWNRTQNLVSRETGADLWQRHLIDSLQAIKYLRPEDRRFLDLGSGGGLPAIPLAIGLKSADRNFILVEPIAKKASFLRTASRELSLELQVEAKRSEALDSRETGSINVITSRALADLPRLLGMAAPFFSANTRAILHKGREHVDELAESAALWHYDVVIEKSDTDASGVLLEISNLSSKSIV